MPEDRTSLAMPGGVASSLTRSLSEPAAARLRKRARVLAVVLVLLAAVIGGGVWLWSWDHGLALFSSGGNEAGGPIPVGRTVYALVINGNPLVGALARQEFTVDVTSVRPHVNLDTAGAAIRVLTCDENGRTIVAGAARSMPYCRKTAAFAPGPLRFSSDLHSSALVLAITAHHRGKVRIAGVDIAYHAGSRSGDQNTGLRLDFRASTALH